MNLDPARRRKLEIWTLSVLFAGTALLVALLAWYKYLHWWAWVNTEGTPMTWYQSLLLAFCGLAAFQNFRAGFLGRLDKPWIWLLTAFAFWYLACDEYLQIHEGLRNKVFAPRNLRLPGFFWTAPGDFMLIVYALAGLALAPLLWRQLAARRASRLFFAAGAALGAVVVGIDSLDFSTMARERLIVEQFIEEVLEAYGMLCFFSAFYLRESAVLEGAQNPAGDATGTG